jgi:predicted nucleotidyltransferase
MAESHLHGAARATHREQLLLALQRSHVEMVMELPDKLEAIAAAARSFDDHGVAYALIGGLAVSVRAGVPRATLDVDFAIPTAVDRSQISARLTACGFTATGAFAHSINFKHASGEPVQLAFDAFFDPMIERAESMLFGELKLRVVTKDDLLAMKRKAAADPGRRRSKALRDLADIALLEGDVPEPNEGW